VGTVPEPRKENFRRCKPVPEDLLRIAEQEDLVRIMNYRHTVCNSDSAVDCNCGNWLERHTLNRN
jgi:hypothetical protein